MRLEWAETCPRRKFQTLRFCGLVLSLTEEHPLFAAHLDGGHGLMSGNIACIQAASQLSGRCR